VRRAIVVLAAAVWASAPAGAAIAGTPPGPRSRPAAEFAKRTRDGSTKSIRWVAAWGASPTGSATGGPANATVRNLVRVSLISHSEHGITEQDFELAKKLDELA